MTSSDRFPAPDRSAVKSNFTNWCCQILSKRALNALTVQASTTKLGKLFQIFTMRVPKTTHGAKWRHTELDVHRRGRRWAASAAGRWVMLMMQRWRQQVRALATPTHTRINESTHCLTTICIHRRWSDVTELQWSRYDRHFVGITRRYTAPS